MDNNTSLHILTLNVQGIRDKNKQRRLFEWCKNQKADVTFIQETHLTPELFSSFDRKFNSIQFNSILYSDCQIHFSASTKHVIKGHQTITNYTLNLGGFDSANWPTRM